jgi:2-dehydro-3-deoxy-D-arabinonate dehydratase
MADDQFLIVYNDNKTQNRQLALQSGGKTYTLGNLSLDQLLSSRVEGITSRLQAATGGEISPITDQLLPPVGSQEIWAAGVTYKRSEEARERESHNSRLYTNVYQAERPELFFKSTGADAVGSGQPAGIRCDASWSVPEPELVIVLNAYMEVVGFTIGNDMSSRDIEGMNPLYLPQAKVYDNACVIGPRIWLQPGLGVWPDVKIQITINRGGNNAFQGETSTANIHRTLADLVRYLGLCKSFKSGVLLFTGTGVIPPDDFTLNDDDEVRIRIDPIGELVNRVAVVGRQV